MIFPEIQCSDYSIGDIVPYKNTRGSIAKCKIKSFHRVGNGHTWFFGFNPDTLSEVFYPVHKPLKLKELYK
jgi:hypothetical protein